MRNRIILAVAALGLAGGGISAYVAGQEPKVPPPAFLPASNPYPKGIYAEGIVESYQETGANMNVYSEVPGVVTQVFAAEGQTVHRGAPLFAIEDSVQRGTVEQQKAQLEAAQALLEELKAQPRPESLEVAKAQVEAAGASLKSAQDTYDKQKRSYEIDPRSVSKDAVDGAENAMKVAEANLRVAERQLDLSRAGAWIYDIRNQERQCSALAKALASSTALLNKYTVRAPAEGFLLAINVAIGSYVSGQGSFDPYTQGYLPAVVMGTPQDYAEVRSYVDEILVHRLPDPKVMQATMFIHGTDKRLPLEFVRIQPYVSPKIELSDQRLERVDVRVLPVIFRFQKPKAFPIYPGQLVDVYIAER